MLSLLQKNNVQLTATTCLDAPLKGKAARIPLLMMKHAPEMEERRFISECI